MNKDKINDKIADLEDELQKLKTLANEPEKRTPEAGDVLEYSGNVWIQGNNNYKTALQLRESSGHRDGATYYGESLASGTYLGKFDEVYVRRDEHCKISDVREALSFRDRHGASIISTMGDSGGCGVFSEGSQKSREALAKLGIK